MFAAMRRQFRKVLCALREHTSVKYAKVVTISGFCDLDHIIIKATAPDDFPLPERYINELLKIFSISPSSFHSFSLSFSRRFGQTHNWKVALKCLVLLHRLLRSLPEHNPLRAELLWARSKGLFSLNPCLFRDDSSSNPEDYAMFITSYAQLLDEALECVALDSKEHIYEDENTLLFDKADECVTLEPKEHRVKNVNRDDEENDDSNNNEEAIEQGERIEDKMKVVHEILEILPQFQILIDRVMECRPIGAAARSFLIQYAMKYIIRDSFKCYTRFRQEIILVLDNLIQMPYRSCIASFGMYKKAANQANELSEFYEWCKEKGLCGSYEYPYIEKIPDIQIQALGSFLNGMWMLTETSNSAITSPSSNKSCSSSQDEDYDKEDEDFGTRGFVVSTKWEKFDGYLGEIEKEEMVPLIQFDDGGDDWEILLDNSIDVLPSYNGGEEMKPCHIMQLYNPNPFINPTNPLVLL